MVCRIGSRCSPPGATVFSGQACTLGLQQLDGMILHLLGREGHMRQEDLAVQLAVDKGAVARSLARLEKRGLVERQVSARCRREKHVSLTSAGEGAYQGVPADSGGVGACQIPGLHP